MTDTALFDLCVIGFSPGGLAAAEAATALGLKVVLVATEHIARPQEARLSAMNIRLYRGAVRFTGRDTCLASRSEVKAKAFILAMSRVWHPASFPGLEQIELLTPASAQLSCSGSTRHIVYGNTAAALEAAQRHAMTGVAVELLVPGALLPDQDPEMTAVVCSHLRGLGVTIRFDIQVKSISRDERGVVVRLEDSEWIYGDRFLTAEQDQAFQDDIGLAVAGVDVGTTGVAVASHFQTTNPKIFAIGQAVAASFSARMERYQAGLVIKSLLFRLPFAGTPSSVPRIVETQPEIASVGLLEAEARQVHGNVHIYRSGFADLNPALPPGERNGFIKVVTNKRGRILGVGVVGPAAREILVPWQVAITRRSHILSMASLIAPPGSLHEISRRVALQAVASNLTRKPIVFALKFLRQLGFPRYA